MPSSRTEEELRQLRLRPIEVEKLRLRELLEAAATLEATAAPETGGEFRCPKRSVQLPLLKAAALELAARHGHPRKVLDHQVTEVGTGTLRLWIWSSFPKSPRRVGRRSWKRQGTEH
jgi:hypothetical protein